MKSRRMIRIAAIVAGMGFLIGGWACASRQVSSGSGDQSTTTKDKGAAETIQQTQIASVPPARGGEETSAPDTRASRFTPSAPPSNSALSGSSAGTRPEAAPPDLAGLGDIFFDFDRYDIRKDAQAVLQENAAWLRREQGKSFLIEGHCDERGTLAYNLVLGEKRAKATKHYLEDLGIPSSRIQTTSYGEIRPFCKEHNEGCWQKNRRAHFAIQ